MEKEERDAVVLFDTRIQRVKADKTEAGKRKSSSGDSAPPSKSKRLDAEDCIVHMNLRSETVENSKQEIEGKE